VDVHQPSLASANTQGRPFNAIRAKSSTAKRRHSGRDRRQLGPQQRRGVVDEGPQHGVAAWHRVVLGRQTI